MHNSHDFNIANWVFLMGGMSLGSARNFLSYMGPKD
jgi:hypothetical protein